MTLLDIISNLDDFDEAATIYAKAPWRCDAVAVVAREPGEGGLPEEAKRLGFDYFLEVFIARDFLEDWMPSCQSLPTPQEKCDRVIQYAMNDA
jgi:hypothetical protein